jgi:hypothetical protein
MAKWIKIEDTKIRNIWKCNTCGDKAKLSPTWYKDNGTPTCSNERCEDCTVDMVYSHTEILK